MEYGQILPIKINEKLRFIYLHFELQGFHYQLRYMDQLSLPEKDQLACGVRSQLTYAVRSQLICAVRSHLTCDHQLAERQRVPLDQLIVGSCWKQA